MDLLTKAKAQLILDQPFFASLLLGMPMYEDKSIPTLATNGDEVRYNPDFMATLSLSEIVFALGHEVMHCVFQHMHRRGSRNPNKWNIAGDYIINDILVKERIGSMIKGCLYNTDIVKQGNETTEGVYNLLPDSDNDKGAGEPGGAMDQVGDAGQDEATVAQKQSEMKVKIIQAANAAKMMGKMPASIERMVKQFTRSKTDWRSVLRRFLTERSKEYLSYAKPKRRFLSEDLYLPSMTGEKLGAVVIAVDCSGSIGPETLERFASEIKAIAEDTKPSALHVVYFDTEILRHDVFTDANEIDIKPIGGGGTAFSPIFRYIDEKEISASACVVLTDLECSDFGEMPGYPVLWASEGRDTAPFGEIVMIKE